MRPVQHDVPSVDRPASGGFLCACFLQQIKELPVQRTRHLRREHEHVEQRHAVSQGSVFGWEHDTAWHKNLQAPIPILWKLGAGSHLHGSCIRTLLNPAIQELGSRLVHTKAPGHNRNFTQLSRAPISNCVKSLQGEAPCDSAVHGSWTEMSPAPSPQTPLPPAGGRTPHQR